MFDDVTQFDDRSKTKQRQRNCMCHQHIVWLHVIHYSVGRGRGAARGPPPQNWSRMKWNSRKICLTKMQKIARWRVRLPPKMKHVQSPLGRGSSVNGWPYTSEFSQAFEVKKLGCPKIFIFICLLLFKSQCW